MPSFRFRLIPFIATLTLVAIGCGLSYWQYHKAVLKEAIEAKLESREKLAPIDLPAPVDLPQLEYTRVRLQGKFIKDWPIYLDNRPLNGAAGMIVIMPFRIQDEDQIVLIERGWLPRNIQNRMEIKPYLTPTDTIQIDGIVTASSGHVMQLGHGAPPQPNAFVQNLDTEEFAQASHLLTSPFFIQQTSELHDGLLRHWPRPDTGSDRNRGYAFQWLGLAAMALIFFIVTGFKREQRTESTDESTSESK